MLQTFHGRLFQVSGNRNFERKGEEGTKGMQKNKGKSDEEGGINFLKKNLLYKKKKPPIFLYDLS